MAEVNLSINGRNYGIACDDGQEKRVKELGYYVDQRIKEIARAGAANNDAHLLVLTALMLADEIYELREENVELNSKVLSSPPGPAPQMPGPSSQVQPEIVPKPSALVTI